MENWTEIKITVPVERVDEAGAIASMTVPYGIYIEDYSNLEEEAMEIASLLAALFDLPGTRDTEVAVWAGDLFEVMKSTVAVQNMIRENKLHQLESTMQAGAADGMCTMDGSLLKLCREGKITKDTALVSCVNYENMQKRLAL